MSAVDLDRDYVRVSDSSSYKPVESVEVTPTVEDGVCIATITVDGESSELLVPDCQQALQDLRSELAELRGVVAQLSASPDPDAEP